MGVKDMAVKGTGVWVLTYNAIHLGITCYHRPTLPPQPTAEHFPVGAKSFSGRDSCRAGAREARTHTDKMPCGQHALSWRVAMRSAPAVPAAARCTVHAVGPVVTHCMVHQ